MDTSMGFRRASSHFSRFVLDARLYLIKSLSLIANRNRQRGKFAAESTTAIAG
jgi:hypothetical protein